MISKPGYITILELNSINQVYIYDQIIKNRLLESHDGYKLELIKPTCKERQHNEIFSYKLTVHMVQLPHGPCFHLTDPEKYVKVVKINNLINIKAKYVMLHPTTKREMNEINQLKNSLYFNNRQMS